MKTLKILLLISLLTYMGCQNMEKDFPDFDYTTTYFPYQYPVRTIVLGDYIYDNSNDNSHKFLISAAMGGVYDNTKDRIIHIATDENLCNNLLFSEKGDTIRCMPKEYYSIVSDKIIIPKGKYHGGVEVELKDAFFNDPASIHLKYVIPVKIIKAENIDSVLVGYSLLPDPDPRNPLDWNITPKDYTLFAVKYINPYHGKYLHKGISVTKGESGTVLEEKVYHAAHTEQNEIWKLSTLNLNTTTLKEGMHSSYMKQPFELELKFEDDGNLTVREPFGAPYTATGRGKFVKNNEEWGNKKRNAIYMEYEIKNGIYIYSAKDTLIVRDRDVKMETYNPSLF
jgi:hypothetical protein